jgi:cyclase
VTQAVGIPVVVNGGAASIRHLVDAVRVGGASAVAAGSMFVFHGRNQAVLINYPEPNVLRDELFLEL